MQHPKTIRIVRDNEHGYCLINEEDFDPEVHQLWKKPEPKKETPPTPPVGNGKK